MPKKAKELGALHVQRLTRPGLHPVGGVAGLRLQVTQTGARSWILRATVGGKVCDKGLGGYPDVSLAGAREAARALRAEIANGRDPIAEGRAARAALRATVAAAWTFDECATACIADKAAGLGNAKHRAQWTSTLKTYATPFIGQMLARDVQLGHVRAVLHPIWTTKTETATRVRARVESVLDWATVHGYREGPNPARWKGNLDAIFPAAGKVSRVEHHAALPAAAVAAFMVQLRAVEGMGAKALHFAILTASRSGEVRGATWAEIDEQAATWTKPAQRMKAGKEHRVPLSGAAMALLAELPGPKAGELIFPAPRGGMLSDMTLSAVLRRMEVPAVPHGFRSTFSDWAAESTNFPTEVVEMALAHAVANKVEAAYRRGDLLPKRRELMEAWAAFCNQA